MKPKTLGQQLLSLHLNNLDKAKETQVIDLFNQLTDLLEEEYKRKNLGGSPFTNIVFNNAIGDLFSAYTSTLKVLTLK